MTPSTRTRMFSRNYLRVVVFMVALVFCGYLSAVFILREPDVHVSPTFQVNNVLRQRPSDFPTIDKNVQRYPNVSDDFADIIRGKYGPVQFSGIRRVNAALSPEERVKYDICVKYAVRDRQVNGSRFWGKEEHIRRTHHTYLAKENAVLVEVGGRYTRWYVIILKIYLTSAGATKRC